MFDLIVVGAGVAGYTAAIRAAKCGLKTACVESHDIGGTCLNRGCIPTKFLVAEMHRYRDTCAGISSGVYSGNISIDICRLKQELSERVGRISAGVKWLLQENHVELYAGHAEFVDAHHIKVNGVLLEGEKFIIATGAVPRELPAERSTPSRIFTTDEMFAVLDEIPASLTVIGGGAVGLEFAFIYAGLGSRVTLLEQRGAFFGDIDQDIERELLKMLNQYGIEYRLGCIVDSVFEDDGSVVVTGADGRIIAESTALLMAVGRVPSCGGMGLEKAGVEYTAKGVITDERGKTSVPGIYAVGDVTGKEMLAYTAAAGAVNAVDDILGADPAKDISVVPKCIFTDLEIAYTGVTEETAKRSGTDYRAARFLMTANGRSASECKGGFVKLITANDTGKVIGGVCVCASASEMINTVTMAILHGLTANQLSAQLFPHPTFSEAICDAADLLDGKCVYMM